MRNVNIERGMKSSFYYSKQARIPTNKHRVAFNLLYSSQVR